MTTDKQAKARTERGSARRAERIEWIIGIISAAVVLALIGFLVYEAISNADGAPELSVELGEIQNINGETVVAIEVVNTGGATASDVVVEGTLGNDVSAITLDYVAGDSSADAKLVFPGQAEISTPDVRVKGFTKP